MMFGRLILPIDGFIVSFGCNNFRCKIVRSSAQSPGDIYNFFGETKIRDLDVAMSIKQQVFRFEIPIDYILPMKIF